MVLLKDLNTKIRTDRQKTCRVVSLLIKLSGTETKGNREVNKTNFKLRNLIYFSAFNCMTLLSYLVKLQNVLKFVRKSVCCGLEKRRGRD